MANRAFDYGDPIVDRAGQRCGGGVKMDDWDDLEDPYFWRWKRTNPIQVQGGIKAQTKEFGRHWWTEKWLDAIEQFGPPRRIARGRSYARKGQVLDLQTKPGLIHATVQGSRETPYEVRIPLKAFSIENQRSVLQELRTRPVFVASLLSGEIHPDTETIFLRYGVPLFPDKKEGEGATCSCPDSANLCKHIAAIYYLISVELERNPFLLFELRGIPAGAIAQQGTIGELFEKPDQEPLPLSSEKFWKAPRLPEISVPTQPVSTKQNTAILQRLGPFPFWRGESDFTATMERLYRAVREQAGSISKHK